MRKPLFLLSLLAALNACATSVGSSTGNNGVQIALRDDVRNCKFLGDVHGVSSFYGVFAAPALESSRQAAMEQAQMLGATHVVWDTTNTNYGSTSINGNAYKCAHGL